MTKQKEMPQTEAQRWAAELTAAATDLNRVEFDIRRAARALDTDASGVDFWVFADRSKMTEDGTVIP